MADGIVTAKLLALEAASGGCIMKALKVNPESGRESLTLRCVTIAVSASTNGCPGEALPLSTVQLSSSVKEEEGSGRFEEKSSSTPDFKDFKTLTPAEKLHLLKNCDFVKIARRGDIAAVLDVFKVLILPFIAVESQRETQLVNAHLKLDRMNLPELAPQERLYEIKNVTNVTPIENWNTDDADKYRCEGGRTVGMCTQRITPADTIVMQSESHRRPFDTDAV